jgi:hypothetical protein
MILLPRSLTDSLVLRPDPGPSPIEEPYAPPWGLVSGDPGAEDLVGTTKGTS